MFGSSGDPGRVPGGGTVHNSLALQAPGIVRWADTLVGGRGPSQFHRDLSLGYMGQASVGSQTSPWLPAAWPLRTLATLHRHATGQATLLHACRGGSILCFVLEEGILAAPHVT